jgi:hypothetical protein
MTIADLFPDQDYHFYMRFERGTIGDFFGPTAAHESLLAERRRWLQEAPELHSALLSQGRSLLDETIELASVSATLDAALPKGSDCTALGRAWEPDFLLMKVDEAGFLRLVGGCVCFPSSWNFAEKVGQPIESIHSIVPGLNPAIGSQIRGFLSKLRPGVAWVRGNWGLSRSAELNQHPARKLFRLDAAVPLEEIWVRAEHQALVALPKTGGILFGIRILVQSLADFLKDASLARRLARAIQTMPPDMARYKNILDARDRVLSFLTPA